MNVAGRWLWVVLALAAGGVDQRQDRRPDHIYRPGNGRAAARAIDLTLDAANAEIAAVVGQAVDIGIGLHAGPVVIGEIGHSSGMAIDIIGETVNTAARLEALTKDEHCQIIASTDVLQLAGADLASLPRKIVHVRGIDAPLVIVAIPAGREIDMTGEKHGNPR